MDGDQSQVGRPKPGQAGAEANFAAGERVASGARRDMMVILMDRGGGLVDIRWKQRRSMGEAVGVAWQKVFWPSGVDR